MNAEQLKSADEDAANPFESAGLLSKLFFSWMTPLVKLGTTRILLEEDVPKAPDANSSINTVARLKECWLRELHSRPQNPSLLRAIYRASSTRLMYSLGNFAIFLCVTLIQPYLVSRILTYVTTGDEGVFGLKSSIAAALFLGLSAGIGALAFNQGFYHMQQFGLTTRTALIGLLFQKSIHVSNTARQTYTAGEIITLMSVDVERIWLGTLLSNWILMGPPMLIAAIILLWFQVGYASLVVAGALIAWGYFQERVSDWIGRTRRKFVKHTAERAKLMNEILQGIRVVKLYAWEEATEARINDVRAEEMKHLEEYLSIRMMNTMLQFLGPVAVAFILFMTYSGMGGEFGVNKAYTCMSILNITRLPIALFPMARSAFQEAVNSIERIRSYLVTPEMKQLLNENSKVLSIENSIIVEGVPEDDLEMVDISVDPNEKLDSKNRDVLISLKNCDFNWTDESDSSDEGSYYSPPEVSVTNTAAEAASSEPLIETPKLRSRSMSNTPAELSAVPVTTRERTSSADYQAIDMPGGDDAADGSVSGDVCTVADDAATPPPAGPCSLNDVNLEVRRGDLVAVVGSVGTGKTSLIHAMLGQMTRVNGKQALNAKVAYASQEHWIQNLTVRDNILFDSAMDEDRYEVAMDASQLSKDLLTLNDGDMTEIGERGINLSGGQKARVNIARALYAPDTDLYIFDDPLASVDVHVGKALFESVMLDVLKEKTMIVVFSSNYHFLPFFSKIVVVGKGGSVDVCNSYDELKMSFPQYASLDGENSLKKVTSGENIAADQLDSNEASAPAGQLLGSVSSNNVTNAAQETDALVKGSVSASRTVLGALTRSTSIYRSVRQQLLDRSMSVKGQMTMTAEDREKGEVSMFTYKRYFQASLAGGFWSNGWVVIALIVVSFAIGQTFRVYCDIWVGTWALDDPDNTTAFYQTVYAGLMLGIILSVVVRSKYFMKQCLEASRALHNGLLKNVLAAPINTYFDVTPIGRILNRFSKDLDQIDSQLPDFFLNMLQNSFHVMAIVILCIASTPYFVVVMVPLSFLYYYIQDQFRKSSRELKRLEGVSRSPLYTLFGELLVGLSTVRAFDRQDSFMAKFHGISDRNNKFFFCFWSCSRWLALRLDLVGVVVVLSVALIAVLMKRFDAPIDSNLLGVALVFSLQLAGLLQWTVRTVIETENNMTSVERLLAFNAIELEDQSVDPVELPPSESWPSKGEVIMEDVVLRYRPGLPKVLNGISMTIPGGAKVGVCGRTGAGKSSLMLALFRIVEPEGGSKIMIDGVDTLSVSLNTLRSRLTIIPQDPVMFSGTLRYNLDPFLRYTDQEVWEALERVQLKDDVLEKFPLKLEHEISERGENISVGQRQLLCIARALLRKSKLIILDEATASVDSFTDQKIQEAIRTAFKDCTVLTIAHRLETVADYDMIMVMDAGKVAEFAMPYELLQLEDGRFRGLVNELGDEMKDSFVGLAKKRFDENKDVYGSSVIGSK